MGHNLIHHAGLKLLLHQWQYNRNTHFSPTLGLLIQKLWRCSSAICFLANNPGDSDAQKGLKLTELKLVFKYHTSIILEYHCGRLSADSLPWHYLLPKTTNLPKLYSWGVRRDGTQTMTDLGWLSCLNMGCLWRAAPTSELLCLDQLTHGQEWKENFIFFFHSGGKPLCASFLRDLQSVLYFRAVTLVSRIWFLQRLGWSDPVEEGMVTGPWGSETPGAVLEVGILAGDKTAGKWSVLWAAEACAPPLYGRTWEGTAGKKPMLWCQEDLLSLHYRNITEDEVHCSPEHILPAW